MKYKLHALAFLMLIWLSSAAQTQYVWKTANAGGYTYRYVTNDPTKTRFYTLKNGLTVILSQNNNEPMITFKMAVRAGSNTDPQTNTGLAHYLEHLLFKGTDKFGTLDYVKEKPLLDKIEALYETYLKTTDQARRKSIYQEIDRISGEAANYAIANEYDKLMQSIGSIGTNAHTAPEETVYEENIPSNALDKFLEVQSERFRAPVFRLFHTELEAVYEEKNRSLDDDRSKMYEGMLSVLFPTHNYGQQTTIGTIEHLKNPSLVEIRKYFNKYYVPNNMALVMSGDIAYDEVIRKIDQRFSYLKPKEFKPYLPAPEQNQTSVKRVDIYGPSTENLMIAYRGYGQNSHNSLMLDLISNILYNEKAGLMDININKQQRMLGANAEYQQMKDYGIFMLSGSPKNGQSLEEAKNILLEQIEILKQGKFDEELIKATVANQKLSELQSFDNNGVRASFAMTAFIQNRGEEWNKMLSSTDDMAKITKKQLVDFANKFFKDNYVVVMKHVGEDKNTPKVDKPMITAVNTNAGLASDFVKRIVEEPVKPIAPKFLDYSKDLKFGKNGAVDIIYARNVDNSIFSMMYRFEMGALNDKRLPYAARYLSFLGTDKYTSEEISQAFYRLACNYQINVGNDITTISITGLQENFDKAAALLEDLLTSCKPNEQALEELKSSMLKSRENAKLDKELIMNGLTNYAQYGADNPFNYGLSTDEIKILQSKDLLAILHQLFDFKHTITYYGPKSIDEFSSAIATVHPVKKELKSPPAIKKFTSLDTDLNKVYFADYDMVQAEIRWVRNSGLYDSADVARVSLFNAYFGGGMGSVVFQSIRESKALAYSTFAVYSTPPTPDKQNVIVAYVGAQADKTNDAVKAMNELLDTLPESDRSFELSKGSLLTGMGAERVIKDNIIYKFLADQKLGFKQDSRIVEYANLKQLSFPDIKKFHQEKLSGKSYNYCIVASEKKIALTELEKLGKLNKLSLEQIFGY
ncbi:M16 family metallopeptidase [Pedobacter rhizosphaerae]|uniref:Predicted Zn-dependent peptidase n=1 Tax=Pedobacter rhizosphaerae TaxID=390241 RepID=A0A1H9SSU9_9SPHI|nr:M16 family metallopeptidase [Pedobacter rhizosphaerae]SER87958.1 Predicted Zn-dependent peptidase [Pedobacter rhizosphaerae]